MGEIQRMVRESGSGYLYFQETREPKVYLLRRSKYKPESKLSIKVKSILSVKEIIFCNYRDRLVGNNMYRLNDEDINTLFHLLHKIKRL